MDMKKNGICVMGSLNIDLTVRLTRFNKPGETVTGQSFHTFTGGKGGNQTVAAARLGGMVRMIACLGADAHGTMYREALRNEGVDASRVKMLSDETSGVALIEVDDTGENRIVIVAGANARLDAAQVRESAEIIAGSHCLLMQLETPLDGDIEAATIAHENGVTVILDPAPARELPDELLALCDYITPNETELHTLTGMPVDTDAEAEAACRRLLARGVGAVINKRGAKGALLVTPERVLVSPGFVVKAVDTTAAGDTFNAGFAVGLERGWSVDESLRLANAAAALSTTKLGAQAAMPPFMRARALMNT